jgi:starch synthase
MTTKETTTDENSTTIKEVKDKEDSTQKSTEVIKNKEKEEEEEIEEEIEEEVEEKDDEEDEPEEEEKNQNETSTNPLPEKTKDGLEISLELIKKFKEIPNEENDNSICNFILEKGLPMDVKDEHTLALILYFHKLCVSFYKILNSLKKKNIEKIFLSSLKESYFLFADDSIKHYNYKSLAKKIFPNLKKSQEEFLISVEFNNPSLDDPIIPTPSVFKINQKILELGLNSQGKLDIYSKIHILKALINFINLEKLKPYTKDFQQMENDLIKLYKNSQREKMSEEKYNEYVEVFTNGEKREDWSKIISSCKKAISIFQNINDLDSIKIYEKLFIQLLGHLDREVRNEAVKVLNIIYDQTTWQEKSPFPLENTNVKLLGNDLVLELTVNSSSYSDKSVVLVCSTPCLSKDINYTVTTFLKSSSEEEDEEENIKLTYNLGKLSKCGYYDWYLVHFSKGRFSNIKIIKNKDIIDGKGRTIVINKDIQNLSAHEVFPDLINAEIDKNQGRITKRGNFKTLESKLEEFHNRFINCLYIMGALERDNNIAYDEETGKAIDIGNTEASPMAVTNRSSISSLLGGENDFKSLVDKAKSLNMKIIVDSLCRISSSRSNRKYRNVLLRYLDNYSKLQLCYGSDGKSVHYEDSTVLNYRKIEAWEMLISEIKTLINKFGIDGLHLDNCQIWPHIMELNTIEMYRIDDDGKPAYTPMEILNGEIVIPNSESGYWESDLCEQYANPLLVKLTREIWNNFPEFIFLGECWLEEKYSQRHVSLVKSGIIPRMYTLPVIICQMLGKKILHNGNMEQVPPENVSIIKEWYKENYQNLPEGAILVQSSSGQVWPYPALLYGRGNWSAIDLLFTLPDVPMTFMNEIDGEAYRVQITNVYTSKDNKPEENSALQSNRLKSRSKSLMKLIEYKEQEQRERERDDNKNMPRVSSRLALNEYLPQYDLSESISSIINLSGISMKNAREIDAKQNNLVQTLKKEDEFDLNKIKFRYDQRREMRQNHKSLKEGKLIYLNAYDNNNNVHPGIFAFARQTPEETGIFAINFRDQETNFLLDLSSLLGENGNSNSICYIVDWTLKNEGEYYFLRELTQSHVTRKIRPYSTVCFGFSMIPFNTENYNKVMEKSNSRLIADLKSMDNNSVDFYQVSLQLKEILEKKLPIEEFNKWMNYVLQLFEKYNINFNDYIKKLDFIKTNESLTSEFFKYCLILKSIKSPDPKYSKVISIAKNLFESNILGPICFVTPELGRWSTVGGLGVMVDELSQGLRSIGQEIIMISPYYNQNRKGKTDYLANDPFNIHYTKNVSIQLDNRYEFGVHYGEGNNGIKYYFLHNASIFPRPYPDLGPADIVREMACFCKASLQLLCDIGTIPAIVVTNDWFTGFTPAYGKCGAFGDVFKGTTFLHICHNLEPSYEGRLYPNSNLANIYQFNPDWVIDPWWKVKILNPSRCAILLSDQWATVSNSYKQDLQRNSPLASLLNQKPHPFAYPNGIFKEKRLKTLLEKAGGDRKECKRYIQQKYFGYKDADYSVPIYSFVGRLTQQKGVLLILDAVEEIVRRTNGKVNILVGGMGNPSDPYVGQCINKINYLRSKYSYAFWANPYEFFTDGPKINFGSDFGLMPSLFEPGGIVQHEFFIAGTPVIAFKTGGLKDTVEEFRYDTNTGNGFTFESHNAYELIQAISRSLGLFQNKEKYEICRKNAKNSAIDVADVSRAWCKEFCRLKNKIFFNVKEAKDIDENQVFELKKDNTEDKKEINQIKKEVDDGLIPITFSYKFEKGKKLNSVLLCGSFTNWKEKIELTFDPLTEKWSKIVRLPKGKHFYKYIVGNDWIINPMERNERGNDGIVNNVVEV